MGNSSGKPLTEKIVDLERMAHTLRAFAGNFAMEEKVEQLKVRKAMEKGDMDGARIHAENAIRKREAEVSYCGLLRRLSAVTTHLDQAPPARTTTTTISSFVKSFGKYLTAGNLEKMTAAMDSFELQVEEMEIRAEFMNDYMAGRAERYRPVADASSLMQQVADDYGLQVSVAGLPQAAAAHATPTNNSEEKALG